MTKQYIEIHQGAHPWVRKAAETFGIKLPVIRPDNQSVIAHYAADAGLLPQVDTIVFSQSADDTQTSLIGSVDSASYRGSNSRIEVNPLGSYGFLLAHGEGESGWSTVNFDIKTPLYLQRDESVLVHTPDWQSLRGDVEITFAPGDSAVFVSEDGQTKAIFRHEPVQISEG